MKYLLRLNRIYSGRLLKGAVMLLAFGYLYYAFQSHESALTGWPAKTFRNSLLPLWGIVLLLMPVNWGLETVKWRQLMASVHPLSFHVALRAVFAGLLYGVFTPQRTGEIPGRALQLPYNKRIRGGALTTLGSLAQHATTMLLGSLGLLLVLGQLFSLQSFGKYLFVALAILMVSVSLLLYTNFRYLINKIGHWKRLPALAGYKLQNLPVSQKLYYRTLLLSMLRYLVFLTQYALLLQILGVDVAFGQALPVIAAIYLTMSIFPSFILSELGIRSSVAVFYLQHFSTNLTGIVAASSVLWVINLLIPILIGGVILLRQSFYAKYIATSQKMSS